MINYNQTIVDAFCDKLSGSIHFRNKGVVFLATISYQLTGLQIADEAMVEIIRDYHPYIINFIRSPKKDPVLPDSVQMDFGFFENVADGTLRLKAAAPEVTGLFEIAIKEKLQ